MLNAGVNESVTDEVIQKLREENVELLSKLRNEENLILKYSDPKGTIMLLQLLSTVAYIYIYRISKNNEKEEKRSL